MFPFRKPRSGLEGFFRAIVALCIPGAPVVWGIWALTKYCAPHAQFALAWWWFNIRSAARERAMAFRFFMRPRLTSPDTLALPAPDKRLPSH